MSTTAGTIFALGVLINLLEDANTVTLSFSGGTSGRAAGWLTRV